jgi:hypothetical protein
MRMTQSPAFGGDEVIRTAFADTSGEQPIDADVECILNGIELPVIVVDRSSVVVRFNRAATVALGLSSAHRQAFIRRPSVRAGKEYRTALQAGGHGWCFVPRRVSGRRALIHVACRTVHARGWQVQRCCHHLYGCHRVSRQHRTGHLRA